MIFLFGCSAETIITDKKIEITVPAIKDSLKAEYKEMPKVFADSLQNIFAILPDSARIEAVKDIEIKSATADKSKHKSIIKKVSIKFFPKRNFFELSIPEHKVDTTFRDTTKLVVKKETSFIEKIGYGTIGIIIFLFAAAIILFKVKR